MVNHIKKVFSSRLSRQYLSWMFFFGTILSVVITTIEIYSHYMNVNTELEKNLRNISVTYTQALSRSIWELHESQAQLIIDGIQLDNRVESVEINNSLLNLRSGTIPESAISINVEKRLYADVLNKKYYVGNFIIYANPSWVLEQSVSFAKARLLSNFVKSFIVILFAFFAFRILVNQHLETISEFFSSGRPLQLPVKKLRLERNTFAYKGSDEIDELVSTINQLGQELHAHIDKVIQMTHEAEASNMRLSEAMRMEHVGKHTSAIAHEFNNSLAIISGIIEQTTRSDALPLRLKDQLRIAESSVDMASQLTQGLLNYSKRSFPYPYSWVDLSKFAKELEAVLNILISKKNNLVVLCLTKNKMYVNKETLVLCLINLVKNSNESFSKGGNISVVINDLSARDVLSNGLPETVGYVNFAIIDDGPGIPEHIKKTIFQPFTTEKIADGGVGLGLWIVKQFVERASGIVTYNSSRNGGCHFNIILPLVLDSTANPGRHVNLSSELADLS